MGEQLRLDIPPLEGKRWPAGDVPEWPVRDYQGAPDRESISNTLAALNLLDVEAPAFDRTTRAQGELVDGTVVDLLRHAVEVAFGWQPSPAAMVGAIRIMCRLADPGIRKRAVTKGVEESLGVDPAPMRPRRLKQPKEEAAPAVRVEEPPAEPPVVAPPAPVPTGKIKIKLGVGAG